MKTTFYYLKPESAYMSIDALESIIDYWDFFSDSLSLERIQTEKPESFSVEIGKKLLSKKACSEIVKEITNTLFERFEAGQDIFTNDADIAKKEMLLLANAKAVIEKRGYPFTMEECKEYFGLHFTEKHSGKMSGMVSQSTNCQANRFCKARINLDQAMKFICFYCFADAQLNAYGKSMMKPFLFNTWLLNRFVIDLDILPLLNARFFRFESFGDIQTGIQEINYVFLMRVNRNTTFAQWTKNLNIMKKGFDMTEKPENLIVIYSNPIIDSIVKLEDIKKRFDFVDKTFNVISKSYARKHKVTITCGARHCLSCLNCYTFGGLTEIVEELRTNGKDA